MTEAPEQSAVEAETFLYYVHEDEEETTPRFAAQRRVAAELANLPARLLLNRARSEGEAHRRAESAEQEALED